MRDAVEFGRFRLCPQRRELRADGAIVPIGARALEVLFVLVGRVGDLVTKEELLSAVWAGAAVEDGAIAAQIAAVRRALGEARGGERWVQTIPGRGYRFVGPVATAASAAATAPDLRPSAAAGRRWRWAASGALAAALALAAVAKWGPDLSPFLAAEPPTRVAAPDLIAVGGPDARDFAHTVREGLIGALTAEQVPAVTAWDPQSPGVDIDARLRALQVGVVLEGAVRSRAGALEVHIVLEDPRAHVTLWSHDFQGSASHSGRLEAQIVQSVAPIVGVAAAPTVRRLRPDIASALLEADAANPASQYKVALLRDVVARAPTLAGARTELAFAIRNAAQQRAAEAQAAAIGEARQQALQALRLDPRDGAPYSLLASATPLRSWRERERLLLQGLAIDSRSVTLSWSYGRLLRQVGRNRDAVGELQQAATIELFGRDRAHAELALALAFAGRDQEAISRIKEAQEQWPDSPGVIGTSFVVAFNTRSFDRARAMLDDTAYASLFPSASRPTWRACIKALRTHDRRLWREAAAITAKAAHDGDVPHGIALLLLASLGDADRAFAEADLATRDAPQSPAVYATFDPAFLFGPGLKAMRQDPRFMTLAARLGLVDYWRTSGHWPDFCDDASLPYDCKTQAARSASIPLTTATAS